MKTNEDKKVVKINILYMLGYIFVPILICALCFFLSYKFFPKGAMAVVLLMGPSALSLIWWIFAGKFLFKRKQKEFERLLDENGFNREQTFYADGCTVMIDKQNGELALIFFWNPFETYRVSLKRVDRAWVDDGKSGAGIFAGSGRVSFLFTIDNVKIRVNTFTSNQRWRMDSDYILTGISKADMMVKIIEEAKKKAK